MNSDSALRIVFAGTPDFAAHYLKLVLADNTHDIVAVYTQPDRPAGRGKKLHSSPVKQLAEQHHLQILQPDSLKQEEAQAELRALEPDLMLVVAYGLLLPEAVLNIPAQGCINVHASLLPRWRGAAPIQRAIEAGDAATGVTIMQMDAGLDTGDMLAKAECDISAMDTGGSLHDKLQQIGEQPLLNTLNQINSGDVHAEVQNDDLSTYAPKLSKQEAAINWSEDAERIDRKIRAFNPFPIAHTEIGPHRIRVHQAFALPEAPSVKSPPGTIFKATEQGIDVVAGKGLIRIKRLQLPGKKALSVSDILRGNASLFAVGNLFQ